MAIGEGSNSLPVSQLENRIVPFSKYVAFTALTHRKRGEPQKRVRDDSGVPEKPAGFLGRGGAVK